MTYKVFKAFRVITPQNEEIIEPGDLIKLLPEKAQGLLEKGKLKPYCYWLEDAVDSCLYPCFEIEASSSKVISECPHFREYGFLLEGRKYAKEI